MFHTHIIQRAMWRVTWYCCPMDVYMVGRGWKSIVERQDWTKIWLKTCGMGRFSQSMMSRKYISLSSENDSALYIYQLGYWFGGLVSREGGRSLCSVLGREGGYFRFSYTVSAYIMNAVCRGSGSAIILLLMRLIKTHEFYRLQKIVGTDIMQKESTT